MKSGNISLKGKDHWNENDLSDPSYFNPIIARQKKFLKINSDDPKEWVKLGGLYEDRASMVDRIIRRSFILRAICIPTFLIFFFCTLFLYKISPHNFLMIDNPLILISLLLIMALTLVGVFLLRNPRSGSSFFKKAIVLDQKCGEAYMHLGFIALRRYQKRKAYCLLEHALELQVDDKRLKKSLKTLYEGEFIKFFNAQRDGDKKKQEAFDSQQEQIKKLQSEIHLHKTNIDILKSKTKQTLCNVKRDVKFKSKELDNQIFAVKKNYQEKIVKIEKEKAELKRENEVDPVIFVNLSDELFESELKIEQLSFQQTVENIKNTVELDLWQSLSRQTKFYVVTAEQTFSIFSKSDDIKDFSLIGLEYCKALELEINKKFTAPFSEYIKERKEQFLKIDQTGERNNKPKYSSYLSMVVDEKNYPSINSLTLGQFHFALKQSLKNSYNLQEFRQFIDGLFSDRFKATPFLFSEKLGVVVKRYRNVIAHLSSMNRVECGHLRELIFFGNDSLLRICSTC